MSMKKNEINSAAMLNISSFLDFISCVFGVSIPQNEKVSSARSTASKFDRFNEIDGNLDRIIKNLSGPIDNLKGHNSISKKEKSALEQYKMLLHTQYELVEIIISTIQSQFLYKKIDSEHLTTLLIKELITPFIVYIHDTGQKLPLFTPATHLLEIATLIYLDHEKEPLLIIKKYLRSKVKKLIKNKDPKAFSIFKEIKQLKYSSITSVDSIRTYVITLQEELGSEKQSIFYDFIGSFYCCTNLLRLRKYLKKTPLFNCFIENLVLHTWYYQQSMYPNESEEHHKLTVCIKDEISNKLTNLFEPKLLTIDEHLYNRFMLCHNLVTHYIYTKTLDGLLSERKMHNFYQSANEIIRNIECFKTDLCPNLTNLLEQGIEYQALSNPSHLILTINELEALPAQKYTTAIIYFIQSIIALQKEDIKSTIHYSELIIKEESKNWHLGKIKSDALIIYISLRLISKSMKHTELISLLAMYDECAPTRIIFTPFINNIAENHITDIAIQSIVEIYNAFVTRLKLNSNMHIRDFNRLLPKNIGQPLKQVQNMFDKIDF